MKESFDIYLNVKAVAAHGVFVALHFFEAGYGYLFDRRYGPPVPNRNGWVVMESPVFILMCVLWACSDRMWQAGPLALFALFQTHYLQRAFIFPLLIRGKSKMPLGIVLMGMVFNTLNALMQGGWIFYVSPADYYAVASWSWAGAVFAWWTFANLAPRAASLRRRYEQEFGEEFTSLRRKRIIPFIY